MPLHSQILIASRDNHCLHCRGTGFKENLLLKEYLELCLYCGGTGEGGQNVKMVES